MKYKVGDKVRIRSKEWYDKHKDANGEIVGAFFDKDRAKLCGTIQTIANNGFIDGLGVTIYAVEDAYEFIGEEAIEGLAEDTDERLLESAADACKKIDEMMEARYQKAKTYYDGEQWPTEFECPSGYQFKDENGNVINATKIVLETKGLTKERINTIVHEGCILFCKHCGCGIPRETCISLGTCNDHDEYRSAIRACLMEKKKKEYPKTFRECQECLGEDVPPMEEPDSKTHRRRQVHLLEVLLICRDAYWKIAGEEMGLGKPWSPNDSPYVYCIYAYKGEIFCDTPSIDCVLMFPTEEMRDAFYENFKELIEQCKELL